ncbi:MAG: DUF192 domain-containing protein [Myxococcales bacterium]|nr:DUF192 domain-containing protein [Myxococcales bacterium]
MRAHAAALLVATLATLATPACDRDGKSTSTPVPPTPLAGIRPDARPPARDAAPAPTRVVVVATDGREATVLVEVARTFEARRQGLMYRQHLPAEAGMLFLFDRDEVHSFWMHNTLVPLDLIFIRADLTVAGVVEDAAPLTDTALSINVPSRHVLEVNAGWSRAHGVTAGAHVRIDGLTKETP